MSQPSSIAMINHICTRPTNPTQDDFDQILHDQWDLAHLPRIGTNVIKDDIQRVEDTVIAADRDVAVLKSVLHLADLLDDAARELPGWAARAPLPRLVRAHQAVNVLVLH
ncbi:hypothetical protein PG997_014073 [Apiospora hydei]|uniref:Uncharacterized protein n=1 Tax=Apiospora hydei TaxID=1337664 RepID=A0ABR1VAI5_9PEZI